MPKLHDWMPIPPWVGPPIPRWLATNPGTWEAWASPEEIKKLEEKVGIWASHRSLSMLSKADVMANKADDFSERMYKRMRSRLELIPLPVTVKEKPPKIIKEVKKAAPPVKEKEEVEAGILKPAKKEDVDLLKKIAAEWRDQQNVFPGVTEIEDIAAKRGFELREVQIKKIMSNLVEDMPISLKEIQEPLIEWIKWAKVGTEWPAIEQIHSYSRANYNFKLTDEAATQLLNWAKVSIIKVPKAPESEPKAGSKEEVLSTFKEKWSKVEKPSMVVLGRELDKLEGIEGIGTSDLRDSIESYTNIIREDYDTAAEYKEAREEALSEVTTAIEDLELEES